MRDDFYRHFEDRFRGSRETIKSRLQIYLPFLLQLQQQEACYPVLDLGCGRGEWLELLQEHGFSPLGVDMDEGMLSACRERNLQVHAGDAIEFIRNLPDRSQGVVSGFHIAEHLPFAALQELVREALRVLQPGGLLILETPNPENLVVGTSSFYLDPTHVRPLPTQLLAFLPEQTGFARVKILRQQEAEGLRASDAPSLYDVLTGVSPDYAVIAQKEGDAGLMVALDPLFEQHHGLSLEDLAGRFQGSLETRFEALHAHATQAEAIATQASAHATQAEAIATQASARAGEAERRATEAEACATRVEAIARQQAAQLEAVYGSTSWRITRPLRFMGRCWTRLRQRGMKLRITPRPMQKMKKTARKTLASAVHAGGGFLQSRPRLKRAVSRLLNRMPGLAIEVRQIYTNSSGAAHWVDDPHSSQASDKLAHGCGDSKLRLDGMNASQRTPLEKYFRAYTED
ncbi:MAG: methyltransferase domain-containing protein [Azovibrio sp.]|uniref:methyltransferase domain-containing protein n=1 Tax=Azovibrio sp. TaxID=1872673 RepID=UPI003C776F4A